MKTQKMTLILGGAAMILGTTLACASQSTSTSPETPSNTSAEPAATAETSSSATGILPLAPHGGLVQESQKLNMELVTEGSEIRLYPLSKMGAAVPAKAVHLSASLLTETKKTETKKKTRLKLNPAGDHFIARLPQKGLQSFELTVQAKAKGETEDFVFKVEPKK